MSAEEGESYRSFVTIAGEQGTVSLDPCKTKVNCTNRVVGYVVIYLEPGPFQWDHPSMILPVSSNELMVGPRHPLRFETLILGIRYKS